MNSEKIITLKEVKKFFTKKKQGKALILDHVNFSIYAGEIIALLGKSGSGKSTLLRIIAGLIAPSDGEVLFRQQAITKPISSLAMVFQHFALLPWLTVLENVELGLEAQGIKRQERRQRALKAIDVVGLDGFESAYPKELSGGMSQRVGLARALVVDPEVLLMDEPFSALDVLTAENLRSDLINIWQSPNTNIKSVLLVTHNIEEAALLADRILIFANDPGYVKAEIPVMLPHPRDAEDPKFCQIVDDIYSLMTTPETIISPANQAKDKKHIDLGYRLPKVQISEILGLISTLGTFDSPDKVDLPELAEELHFEIDELFPITEVLEILHFARVSEGDIQLTSEGKALVTADIQQSKKIFATHLLKYVPFVRHIRETLDKNNNHTETEEYFLNELENHLSKQASEEVLTIIIDWGRYAELFAYDYNSGLLSLEDPS